VEDAGTAREGNETCGPCAFALFDYRLKLFEEGRGAG
jgi:hypothetical protein